MQPEDALRLFYEEQGRFYAGGELEPVAERLTEDVIWHVPGSSAIAGDHRGREAVGAYFEKRRRLSGGSFRVNTGEVAAFGGYVVQFAQGEAELDGRRVCWDTFGVFRVRGEQIAECWLVPLDQEQFDRLWR